MWQRTICPAISVPRCRPYHEHALATESFAIGGGAIALRRVADLAAELVETRKRRRIGHRKEPGRHDHVVEDISLRVTIVHHVELPRMRSNAAHARHPHTEMDIFQQVEFGGISGEISNDLAAHRKHVAARRPGKIGESTTIVRQVGAHIG